MDFDKPEDNDGQTRFLTATPRHWDALWGVFSVENIKKTPNPSCGSMTGGWGDRGAWGGAGGLKRQREFWRNPPNKPIFYYFTSFRGEWTTGRTPARPPAPPPSRRAQRRKRRSPWERGCRRFPPRSHGGAAGRAGESRCSASCPGPLGAGAAAVGPGWAGGPGEAGGTKGRWGELREGEEN